MGISRTVRRFAFCRLLWTSLRRTAQVLLLACVAAGCSLGMTATKYPPALGPRGVGVRLDLGQRQVVGELIVVRDSGVVILTGGTSSSVPTAEGNTTRARDQARLQFVAYRDILSSKVDRTSASVAVTDRQAPDPGVRERLRLLSRFPQGLTADLLKRLLAAHGQTELPGVTP